MNSRHAILVAAALALAGLVGVLSWGSRRSARRAKPNVVFIAVDTLRADHLGCYGSTLQATPRIDALASRSTRFTRTLSPSNVTSCSFASLFTGTFVKTHGVFELSVRGFRLDSSMKTMAEYLKDEGYATLGAVSVFHMNAALSGFAQGFDRYLDFDGQAPKQPAQVTTDRLLAEVKALRDSRDGDKPLFLFAHYFDPHWPYAPPPPFDSRYWTKERPPDRIAHSAMNDDSPERHAWADFFRAQYAGEVAYVDREIGRLLDGLDAMGLDDAIVLFTADHGENLGEHDLYFNHGFMYRAVTNVPLLVHLPAQRIGKVSDALAQGLDLLPTLLDLLGVAVPPDAMDGSSLLAVVEGRRAFVHTAIFSEAARLTSATIQEGSRKLVYRMPPSIPESESYELYDLAADPEESTSLVDREADVLATLRERLHAFTPAWRLRASFGASSTSHRYRAAIRGLKGTIVDVEPRDLEADERATREPNGEVAIECTAGGGDRDEVVLAVDRASCVTVSIEADGKAVGADQVAIDGRPFGQEWLMYLVDWAGGEPLAPVGSSSRAEALLARGDASGTRGRWLRLDVGTPPGTEDVFARVYAERNLLEVSADSGRFSRTHGPRHRVVFRAPKPAATFRIALDEAASCLLVAPRIGDRGVFPADFAVSFPVRRNDGIEAIPFVCSARFGRYWDDAIETTADAAPVTLRWEAVGRSSHDPAAEQASMRSWRTKLRALGYAGEDDER